MEKYYTVRENGITVHTALPLQAIIRMETAIKENEHGSGMLEAVVMAEYGREALHTDFCDSRIVVEGEGGRILFDGLVGTVAFHAEGGYTGAEIGFTSRSILLDREVKKRSFQNADMPYERVAEETVRDYGETEFSWFAETGRAIGVPIIQYGETDWEFMKRLAGHFHTVIYPACGNGNTCFRFGVGMGNGVEWEADSSGMLAWGIDGGYYTEGYGDGISVMTAAYMETEGSGEWEIGDRIIHSGSRYTVFRKNMLFSKGEAVYTYLLGKEHFTYRKRRANERLKGVRLKGTVRRAEMESIYIRLDMDKEEKADYPWPWVPETGNLCYCMPEIGTEVMLYFPSGEERDGIALHALRGNRESSACGNVQNRELHTRHDRKAGLYPDRMFMEGKDGAVSLKLEDGNGVRLDSSRDIVLEAAGGISINGRKCMSSAPVEILYRTSRSNIEICRDFNFYAPGGVQTNGKVDGAAAEMPTASGKDREPDGWQISYSAMAAVPAENVLKFGADGVMELAACSAVPKIAGGRQTLAMEDVMAGKSGKDVRFPDALQGMEIFTVKGGHTVPEDE